SIINLAFGAVVIGGAAAAALAFGLGGRDAAARMLGKGDLDEAAGAANTGGDSGATGGGVGTSGASNSGPGATGGPDTPGTNGGAASAGDPQDCRSEPFRDRHLRPGVPRGGGRREDLDAPTLLSSPAHGDRTSRSEAWAGGHAPFVVNAPRRFRR